MVLGWESAGVLAISVAECKAQILSVIPDPSPFPEHVLVDFNSLASNSAVDNAAKKLRDEAKLRGWMFRPQL